MNLKRTLTSTLAAAALLLAACGDDDKPSPKAQFTFTDETLSLKDANIYFTYEGGAGNETHVYRDYFITDGTYTNDDGDGGWSLEDYTGATYFIAIELGVPLDEEFETGSFPQLNNWTVADDNQKVSYIYFESGDEDAEIEYYTDDANEDDSPVVVSGGLEDGDNMTVKFSGKLTYYYYNGTNWVEESVSGKFYFKGEVDDAREVGVPLRKPQGVNLKGHRY